MYVCCVYASTPGNSVRDDGVDEKMEAGAEGTVLAQKNKIGVLWARSSLQAPIKPSTNPSQLTITRLQTHLPQKTSTIQEYPLQVSPMNTFKCMHVWASDEIGCLLFTW